MEFRLNSIITAFPIQEDSTMFNFISQALPEINLQGELNLLNLTSNMR